MKNIFVNMELRVCFFNLILSYAMPSLNQFYVLQLQNTYIGTASI